uniref:T-cell leukemia/lymphoma 6 ORF72 n=1 Tax=Homo sapiens TaxID=9606 RepID=Q9NPF3_HUMAN|nr:T-cell leukemia/lymphoma 6 ORF72 [Homo sapiens]BAA96380.1 T-cell leukemia/lymphoma 6 ORF72 [Homo sapiens]BAA96382.1 TML1 beta ORF72 [Homo sapiens]BAA96384.1 T-cell leukemia/lymphoma 6 ORF72 [Homo sapiens]
MALEGAQSGCGLGCPVGISSADTLARNRSSAEQAMYTGASVSPSAQWGAWRDGFGLCFCLFSPSAHGRDASP